MQGRALLIVAILRLLARTRREGEGHAERQRWQRQRRQRWQRQRIRCERIRWKRLWWKRIWWQGIWRQGKRRRGLLWMLIEANKSVQARDTQLDLIWTKSSFGTWLDSFLWFTEQSWTLNKSKLLYATLYMFISAVHVHYLKHKSFYALGLFGILSLAQKSIQVASFQIQLKPETIFLLNQRITPFASQKHPLYCYLLVLQDWLHHFS